MAIVSTLVSLDLNIWHLRSAFNLSQADVIFKEFTTRQISSQLIESSCQQYLKDHKLLHNMDTHTDYHHHYLTKT
jgi:lipid A disaccharide synthetase